MIIKVMLGVEQTGIDKALMNIWVMTNDVLVRLVGAIILVLIGFIVGKVSGRIVREILVRSRLDEIASEEKYLNIKPSHLGDVVTRWVIYLVFIQQATEILAIQTVTEFIGGVYNFILGVVAAALTILIGYGIAVYIKDKIITSKTIYSDITGKLVFTLILYLSIAIGLKFIKGVDTTILDYILLVLVGSAGAGMALAIGLGLKDVIREMAMEWKKAEKKQKRKK